MALVHYSLLQTMGLYNRSISTPNIRTASMAILPYFNPPSKNLHQLSFCTGSLYSSGVAPQHFRTVWGKLQYCQLKNKVLEVVVVTHKTKINHTQQEHFRHKIPSIPLYDSIAVFKKEPCYMFSQNIRDSLHFGTPSGMSHRNLWTICSPRHLSFLLHLCDTPLSSYKQFPSR